MKYEKFYAHSTKEIDKSNWHLLGDHLNEVGKLAKQFAFSMGNEVARAAEMAGLLHDLGKYTEEFQQRLEGDYHKVDHSTRGAKMACDLYEKMGYLIAYAIAGHHCGLADGSGKGGRRRVLKERLKEENLPALYPDWKKEIEVASKLFPPNFKRSKHEMFQCAFLIRMIFSCLVDADFLDTGKFFLKVDGKNSKRGFGEITIAKLSEKLDAYLAELVKQKENKNRDILNDRKKILESVNEKASKSPGLFSLTVPTGGGKTLSSLSFALKHALKHGLERIIYVAPYTSIIEQNAEVFRKVFKGCENIVLEHHSSFMNEENSRTPDQYQSSEKLKLAMENWDCPVIATTAVQFFESLFSGRPSMCRKLHNIANSVVILDEAQTIPLHVLRPCIEVLKELSLNYKTSIVLCTATQPALLEKDGFKEGFKDVVELAPEPKKMFERFKRVKIQNIGFKKDDELIKEIKNHEQVLCIVNSRLHARYLFKELKEQFCYEEEGIYHLTTAMCARHRYVVLNEIRNRLKKNESCRLVATSLIEAGVDIDFPLVFRAEAGLDSIAQAAGRCNREGKRPIEKSFVKVFSPDSSKWKAPLEIKQYANKAQSIFENKNFQNDLISLEAIKKYFTELFWQKDQGDTELDGESILELLSHRKIEGIPFETVEKKFCMIKSDGQRPVIINYKGEIDELLKKIEYVPSAARRFQPYTVQVPERAYNTMRQEGAIRLIAQEEFGDQFALLENNGLYSDDAGLDWSNPSYIKAENLIFS